MIGQQWKQLPPHEKAHYEAIAAEDKARYLKEIAALGQDVVQTESESKSHSTPAGVAHARGKAFQAFCMERQTSNDPKSSVKEQKKALITEWNALTPEQRATYKGKVSPESKQSVLPKGKKKRNAEKKIAKTESSKTETKRRKSERTSERTDVKEGASSSDTESNFDEDEDEDVDREVRVLLPFLFLFSAKILFSNSFLSSWYRTWIGKLILQKPSYQKPRPITSSYAKVFPCMNLGPSPYHWQTLNAVNVYMLYPRVL